MRRGVNSAGSLKMVISSKGCVLASTYAFILPITPIVRQRGRRITERNGDYFAADHEELFGRSEMFLELIHLFLTEPFEVFFSEADDEEGPATTS